MAMHFVSHSPHVHQLTSLSHAVTVTCDMTISVTAVTPFCDSVTSYMIFLALHLSNNLKEKKRNINNDLAVLPNHDILLPNKVQQLLEVTIME